MLTQFDDYPIHQSPAPVAVGGGDDENLYDRYFFAGFSNKGEYYFGAALGLYPNRQVQDAHFSIAVGGEQHSFHGSRRAPKSRSDNSVGPMNVEVVEPMRVLRITIAPNKTGIEADVTFTASTVALEEPRSVMKIGKKVIMDTCRFAQFGSWRGWIKANGQRHEIGEECLGVRDRSWGVRPAESPKSKLQLSKANGASYSPLRQRLEQRMTSALFPPMSGSGRLRRARDIAGLIGGGILGVEPGTYWVWNLNFFDDVCTHFASFETLEGEASQLSAAVIPRYDDVNAIPEGPDSGLRETDQASHEIVWTPGSRSPQSVKVSIGVGKDALVMTHRPLIKFHLAGIGYGHPDWLHGHWKGGEVIEGERWCTEDFDKPLNRANNHIHQMCEVIAGERRGVGIFESLCVGAYQPAGFRQRFDSAPDRAVTSE